MQLNTANTSVTWSVTRTGTDIQTEHAYLWQPCCYDPYYGQYGSYDGTFFGPEPNLATNPTSIKTTTKELKSPETMPGIDLSATPSRSANINNAVGKYTFVAMGLKPQPPYWWPASEFSSSAVNIYVLDVDLCVRDVAEEDEVAQGAYLQCDADTAQATNTREFTGMLTLKGRNGTDGKWQIKYPSNFLIFWDNDGTWEYLPSEHPMSVSFTYEYQQDIQIPLRIRATQTTNLRSADLKAYFTPDECYTENANQFVGSCSVTDLVKCTVVDVAVSAKTKTYASATFTESQNYLTKTARISPGLYLGVNTNTQESASQRDCDHLGVVSNDPDLRSAILRVQSGTDVKGKWLCDFAVSPPPNSPPLKLWDCTNTPSEISLGVESVLLTTPSVNNTNVRIEGLTATSLQGAAVSVTFTPYDDNDNPISSQVLTDTLNISVVDVNLSVNGATEVAETSPGTLVNINRWSDGAFSMTGTGSGTQVQGQWRYDFSANELSVQNAGGTAITPNTVIATSPTYPSVAQSQTIHVKRSSTSGTTTLAGVFIPYDATSTHLADRSSDCRTGDPESHHGGSGGG